MYVFCSKGGVNLVFLMLSIVVTLAGCQPQSVAFRRSLNSSQGQDQDIKLLTDRSETDIATAEDVLLGKDFWSASGVKSSGAMPVGTHVSGKRGDLALLIPRGFYDGTKIASVSDVRLNGNNICSDTSIFGVTGTSVCLSGNTASPATAGHILLGRETWDSSGTKITGTMLNRGTVNASTALPGAGYYDGTLSNPPLPSNICSSTSVLGIPGSALCNGIALTSNAPRDLVTSPISMFSEVTTYSGAGTTPDLPPGYREVPMISKDDEGSTGNSVARVNRISNGAEWSIGVPRRVCGKAATSIAAKISDCDSRHNQKPIWDDSPGDGSISWDGNTKGNAGHGRWTLVTVYSNSDEGTICGNMVQTTCTEVWRDDRTGLLWSDRLNSGAGVNWCRASGSNNSTVVTDPIVKEDDPSDVCDNNVYQNQNTLVPPDSACFEHPQFSTVFTNDPGKGGLRKSSLPAVRWRLPSAYDYLLANVNGFRFVLAGGGGGGAGGTDWEWSSTINSGDRSQAWVISSTIIYSIARDRSSSFSIRCVGR